MATKNKNIKKSKKWGIEVKKSKIHGLGVYATQDFRRGDLIGVMSGRITEDCNKTTTMFTCLFAGSLNYVYQLEPKWPFCYLNHSKKNYNARMTSPCIVALRKINCGEEILVHYGGEYWKNID